MSKWQPIETAPKDGTEFLAWCMERPPFSPVPTYFPDIAKWHKDRVAAASYFYTRSGAIPTHWMPIPDAPK